MGHPVFGADQSAHAEQLQGNGTILRNQAGENGTVGTEKSFTAKTLQLLEEKACTNRRTFVPTLPLYFAPAVALRGYA